MSVSALRLSLLSLSEIFSWDVRGFGLRHCAIPVTEFTHVFSFSSLISFFTFSIPQSIQREGIL